MLTCSELSIVNIQANTLDSWLTAKRPNTHVIPSKGSSIIVAFNIVLNTNAVMYVIVHS